MLYSIFPVILAGGSGTRLWPLSRSIRPKQFIDLIGGSSLFQETLDRVQYIPGVTDPIIVCNEKHRFMVAQQIQEKGTLKSKIILEPVARNTAPAITVAVLYLKSARVFEKSLILVLPADHMISDIHSFIHAITLGQNPARNGKVVTFGIRPERPSTGYGYIKTSESSSVAGGTTVENFIEKPNLATAEKFLAAGDWFWNSGILLFEPDTFLTEVERYLPKVLTHSKEAFSEAFKDPDFIRLDHDRYARCQNISIDYAILEKSNLTSMVPMDAGWCDIGSWDSLWNVGDKDKAGNVIHGDVFLENVNNSYIYSENRLITAIGVDSLIIVETQDSLLVSSRGQDQAIRQIVVQLQNLDRAEVNLHRRVFRPWGYFDFLESGHQFQVKRIMVEPGGSTSLQKHRYRTEHWVVISGVAEVTLWRQKFPAFSEPINLYTFRGVAQIKKS